MTTPTVQEQAQGEPPQPVAIGFPDGKMGRRWVQYQSLATAYKAVQRWSRSPRTRRQKTWAILSCDATTELTLYATRDVLQTLQRRAQAQRPQS